VVIASLDDRFVLRRSGDVLQHPISRLPGPDPRGRAAREHHASQHVDLNCENRGINDRAVNRIAASIFAGFTVAALGIWGFNTWDRENNAPQLPDAVKADVDQSVTTQFADLRGLLAGYSAPGAVERHSRQCHGDGRNSRGHQRDARLGP
jgi:hypothetical protein